MTMISSLLILLQLLPNADGFQQYHSPSRILTRQSRVGGGRNSMSLAIAGFGDIRRVQRQQRSSPRVVRSVTTHLRQSKNDEEDEYVEEKVVYKGDPLVVETSNYLRRVSWFSWWAQVILTTISSVILFFVKSVFSRSNSGGFLTDSPPNNFVLSGTGLIISFISIIWTWGNGTRLSRRMIRKPTSKIQAATLLRRAIRIGVTLNVIGLFINLIAAEEIVGSLAIKVMTTARSATGLMGGGGNAGFYEVLQPLDILVVQANTNSLLANFCSMVCLLYLTNRVQKLDPPSTSEVERK